MPEQLFFTAFLNRLLGPTVARALAALNAHPVAAGEKSPYLFTYNPAAPISNYVAMEVLIFLILIVIFVLVRARLSATQPRALPHLMALVEEFRGRQRP